MLPPNVLNPGTYCDTVIKKMADKFEWEMSEWDANQLREEGMSTIR
jgi:leucyl aminopeptidase